MDRTNLTKMVDTMIGGDTKAAGTHFHDYVTDKVREIVNPPSLKAMDKQDDDPANKGDDTKTK